MLWFLLLKKREIYSTCSAKKYRGERVFLALKGITQREWRLGGLGEESLSLSGREMDACKILLDMDNVFGVLWGPCKQHGSKNKKMELGFAEMRQTHRIAVLRWAKKLHTHSEVIYPNEETMKTAPSKGNSYNQMIELDFHWKDTNDSQNTKSGPSKCTSKCEHISHKRIRQLI